MKQPEALQHSAQTSLTNKEIKHRRCFCREQESFYLKNKTKHWKYSSFCTWQPYIQDIKQRQQKIVAVNESALRGEMTGLTFEKAQGLSVKSSLWYESRNLLTTNQLFLGFIIIVRKTNSLDWAAPVPPSAGGSLLQAPDNRLISSRNTVWIQIYAHWTHSLLYSVCWEICHHLTGVTEESSSL